MPDEALEAAAAALAASLGTQQVSSNCAAALQTLLPGAEFLRASVRCGTGLFVSDDLLRPGPILLSVASLRRSMAGLAMAQRQPVVVAVPGGGASGTARQVLCLPVALQPTASGGSCGGSQLASADSTQPGDPPLYVGALMVGSAAADGMQLAPGQLWAGLQALADAAAPYLLLLGLAQAEQMGELLRLRAADTLSCSGEEDELQDVPLEGCAPPLPPGGGAGGAAGALPAAGKPGSSEPPAEAAAAAAVDPGAQQRAVAAALSKRSRLAGGEAGGPGSSSGSLQQQGAAPAASKQRQAAGHSADAEEAEEHAGEEGPKAAFKGRQAAGAAAQAAAAAAAPRGLLLRFVYPATEARYAAAHNRSLTCGDALFAAMHLCAALCVAVLHPASLAGSHAVHAFLAALLAPLLALALDSASYVRHRELLLAVLLVSHAALLRSASLPSLLRLLPPDLPGKLPGLLRATGAEALAVFPLGLKLRLHLFLPVHALCVALVGSALPAYCSSAGQASGCLRSMLRPAEAALLLLLSCAVPALVIYKSEVLSRQRFLQMERRLRA
ncbi:hypothetical protein ABPG75_011003 [Micractinium tetrahymenae]